MDKTILYLPILIAFIFGVTLYIKSGKGFNHFKILGNYFFLYVLLFASMTIVGMFNDVSDAKNIVSLSSLLFFTSIITIPPTFYSYIVLLSDLKDKNFNLKKHYYIPGILLIINCISFISLLIITDESSYINELIENFVTAINFIGILFIFPILNIYYITQTIRIYKKHSSEINQVFSYKKGVDLRWMLHYILGYIVFILGLYITQFSDQINLHLPIRIFISAYFIYVGINGVKQSKINFKSENNSITEEEKPSISKGLKEKIVAAMSEDELYLDTSLTVHKLAKSINSNSKYISNVINTEFQQNFAVFVNSYRIEKAKKILINPDFKQYTIESISKEVGFNSKSAFNIAFKKITNQTPSEFRKPKF
jgi:AraC-like DNA-binding protein